MGHLRPVESTQGDNTGELRSFTEDALVPETKTY